MKERRELLTGGFSALTKRKVDQVRVCHQHADRERTRHWDAPGRAGHCRRGHRVAVPDIVAG